MEAGVCGLKHVPGVLGATERQDPPCAVSEDVSAVEGVERNALPHGARHLPEQRVPAAEQLLILGRESSGVSPGATAPATR